MIKIIIFDFDDTLYSDTNPIYWKKYCINTIKYFLLDRSDFSSILEKIKDKGFSDKQLIRFLVGYDIDEKKILEYFENNSQDIATFDNCNVVKDSVLKKLQENFNLYIVSNSLLTSVLKNMNHLKINKKYFNDIISNDNETKELAYKKILCKENVKPEEILVVGNSYEHDIIPAEKLGMNGRIVKNANFEFKDFFDNELNLK